MVVGAWGRAGQLANNPFAQGLPRVRAETSLSGLLVRSGQYSWRMAFSDSFPATGGVPDGTFLGPAAACPGDGFEDLPLLNLEVLEDLGADLNDGIALRFATDYAQMWDYRHRWLATAIERQDSTAALEAVISLKTSSVMVGGSRLAHLAGMLEAVIRGGNMSRSMTLLTLISKLGSATVMELRTGYIRGEQP